MDETLKIELCRLCENESPTDLFPCELSGDGCLIKLVENQLETWAKE